MRIAHVTDCYFPRLGGIEIQVHDLAAHQLLAGHQPEILTTTQAGPGLDDAVPDRLGPRIRRLGALTGNMPSPAGLAGLRRAIESGRYDVVHAHSSVASPLAWSALRAASQAGVPVTLTLHSLLRERSLLLAASAAAVGWARWPVAWTAVSSAASAPLRAVLGDDRVGVLPNGLEIDAWRLAEPRPAGGLLTIASVMRLSPRKRPVALLRILARIRDAVPADVPLRAVIVGEGPQRPALERTLRAWGLDRWVTLTGALSRSQVREVLHGADVYLAPAQRESFGIAALEARCAGLPVIGMASGGVREFIRHGGEGFLAGSDAEMAALTAALLMSPRLPIMQEHNRCTVPDLSWPQVVARTGAVYRQAARVAGAEPIAARSLALRV